MMFFNYAQWIHILKNKKMIDCAVWLVETGACSVAVFTTDQPR